MANITQTKPALAQRAITGARGLVNRMQPMMVLPPEGTMKGVQTEQSDKAEEYLGAAYANFLEAAHKQPNSKEHRASSESFETNVTAARQIAGDAIRQQPRMPIHWYRYGLACAWSGRIPEAQNAFEKANSFAREFGLKGYEPANHALKQMSEQIPEPSLKRKVFGAAYNLATDIIADRYGISLPKVDGKSHSLTSKDGYVGVSPQTLTKRFGETDADKQSRIVNNLVISSVDVSGAEVSAAEMNGIISDVTMGIPPTASPKALEAMGLALLRASEGERVDVRRWLGHGGDKNEFVEEARSIGTALLAGALKPQFIENAQAQGLDKETALLLETSDQRKRFGSVAPQELTAAVVQSMSSAVTNYTNQLSGRIAPERLDDVRGRLTRHLVGESSSSDEISTSSAPSDE
jgi:hypothetical protein